jgi:hypothetical protein
LVEKFIDSRLPGDLNKGFGQARVVCQLEIEAKTDVKITLGKIRERKKDK